MGRLKDRIVDLIDALGPLPVSEYMAMCLFDPSDGYYTTKEPFGRGGDFVTAPEVSQMFGELVGVWVVAAWRGLGKPMPVTVAEIGPGRGTMMKDMLRVISRLAPDLAGGATFALIEASPRLIEVQRATLAATSARLEWHSAIEKLADAPLIVVGNEIFDAIPIRQFIKAGNAWRERAVGLDDADNLVFVAGAGSIDPGMLPGGATLVPDGAIFEAAPARTALISAIAAHIAVQGGAGLFFDYGHLQSDFGDTLQAVRRHAYEDVLASPGEADLTAHVDFEALATEARSHGLDVRLSTQGDFLPGMGLLERASSLGQLADEATRDMLRKAVIRLTSAREMGRLFKVMEVVPAGFGVIANGIDAPAAP